MIEGATQLNLYAIGCGLGSVDWVGLHPLKQPNPLVESRFDHDQFEWIKIYTLLDPPN